MSIATRLSVGMALLAVLVALLNVFLFYKTSFAANDAVFATLGMLAIGLTLGILFGQIIGRRLSRNLKSVADAIPNIADDTRTSSFSISSEITEITLAYEALNELRNHLIKTKDLASKEREIEKEAHETACSTYKNKIDMLNILNSILEL